MNKVHYLNSHLEKFREEKRIIIDVENIGDLAQYGNMGGEDKKTTQIFTECFNNKETYKQILNLYPSHKMLLQHWKVGHSKLAWNVRKNPKVINIFKHLWDTDDLIVSFDGVSVYILDKPTRKNNSCFHVDQSYTRNKFECIQSWINAYDTKEGDATLVILEGSNNYHKAFQDNFNILDKKDRYKLNEEEIQFYNDKKSTK